MSEKILIVDDEVEIADLIEVYLKNENYTVFKFYTATEALECINTTMLDLAILDIMLPDINGFTLCQKIRERYTYPVIMLTAKDAETDKITGLTLGADDYITKPFRPLEMVARVKSQLRRYKKYNVALPDNSIELDFDENTTIYADPEKLARVFSNILKNAVTYSYPDTKIIVSVENTEKHIAILFQNQGETIPAEKLSSLFDKFYRLDEARISDTGGTGLGLAIAKEIVLLHGGTIEVKSENKTITFSVILPVS